MADDVQYVKLPSGEYGKFRADASDDAIRSQIMKDFPSAFESQEQSAIKNPPVASFSAIANAPQVGPSGEALPGGGGEAMRPTRQAATRPSAAALGAHDIGSGLRDFDAGNYKRGTHELLSGAMRPVAMGALPVSLAAAPLATLSALGAGATSQEVGKYGSKALGADEDTSNLIGDAAGFAGGYGGTKLGGAITPEAIGRFTRTPGKVTLGPGGDVADTITKGPLKPWVKGAMSPFKLVGGPQIADAILPAHPEPIGATSRLGRIPISPENNLNQNIESHNAPIRAAFQSIPAPTGDIQPKNSSPRVLLAPIKNGPFPNNPSGNIQNVPRELLPDIIQRTGDPAAVNEFQRTTNTPTLFVPESYGGPRQTPWSPNAPGNPIPVIPSPDVTPTSAPDPTPAYAGAERRTSVRDITGPDFMRGAQMQDIRNRLSEPSLPDAERAILQNRLDDMRAHPFERNELGNDLNAFKTQKTMTRAEAEANTQKRMEGRNKRFGL